MTLRIPPKTVLATLAAVGLLLPLGASLPGSCLRTIGVAGAAPSPSCGGDLRECLRQSADLRQTTFGGRYVTADDVAKCMEAFQSCISGGASRGGNPVPLTPADRGDVGGLPSSFRISFDATAIDCRINGGAVTCTEKRDEALPSGGSYSYSGDITGTLSGLAISGTRNGQSTSSGHSSGCVSEQDHSGRVSFDFNRDGSVAMRLGPGKVDTVFTGTCSNAPPMSETVPVWEVTGTWSPSG